MACHAVGCAVGIGADAAIATRGGASAGSCIIVGRTRRCNRGKKPHSLPGTPHRAEHKRAPTRDHLPRTSPPTWPAEDPHGAALVVLRVIRALIDPFALGDAKIIKHPR